MKPVKKFRFIFKLPDPKQFEYQPRYYDPLSERAKEREQTHPNDPQAIKSRISAAFRREVRAHHDSAMLWRRVVIFGMMVAIAYYYLIS